MNQPISIVSPLSCFFHILGHSDEKRSGHEFHIDLHSPNSVPSAFYYKLLSFGGVLNSDSLQSTSCVVSHF